ncbi:MAG TPA: hypothetical protein IAC31_03565 [Candidatus Faecousia intestinigallinarum]|nr:hypothetical protein [Candidatus Faecousia intestinigallinarum]
MKNQVKAVSLILALVLLLSLLPIGALAEEHIHDYEVTTVYKHCDYYDDNQHVHVERHQHLCSCGATYYETHREYEIHKRSSSGTYIGSGISNNGGTVHYYRYYCSVCKSNFIIDVPV